MFRNHARFYVAGALLPALALAQGGEVQDATPVAGLEEITVTARRQEESLQKVPVAVSALSMGDLENRSIDNLSDVARSVPNVEMTSGAVIGSAADMQVTIRGIGQNDPSAAMDPGVGIYVDGVYYARPIGTIMGLVGIERIEVLRGPQGTLFGKNTMGGAVNITSARPAPELSGKVEAITGSYDRIDFNASLDIPLGERFGARISALTNNRDGYGRTGVGDAGSEDSKAVRGLLEGRLTDSLTLTLAADYTKQDQTPLPTFFPYVAPDGQAPLRDLYNGVVDLANFLSGGATAFTPYHPTVSTDVYRNDATGEEFMVSDLENWGASATFDWQVNDVYAFKSITAYRDLSDRIGNDMDIEPVVWVHSRHAQNQDQFTQEFQLNRGGDRFSFTAGLFYFTESSDDTNDSLIAADLVPAFESLPGPIVPAAPGVDCGTMPEFCFGGAGNPMNAAFWTLYPRTYITVDTDSYAAYFSGQYQLTERWRANFGGRYTDERKRQTSLQHSLYNGALLQGPFDLEKSWTDFAPKVGLDFFANDSLMLYLSYSTGFKSGGWNPRHTQPTPPEAFDPEEVDAFEVGMKSEWLDRRLRLNAAAFYYDYADMQVNVMRSTSLGQLALNIENAGNAEVRGAELELTVLPVQAVTLNASVGYTDAKYTELAPGTIVTRQSRLPRVSDWTATVGAQYGPRLGNGNLLVRADWSWRSKYYQETSNNPHLLQDAFGLLTARLAYESDSGWNVALFGTNLTDEEYLLNGYAFLDAGLVYAYASRPREWGLSVGYRF